MIHIKCKKCGYRLPFSSKIDGFTARSRLKGDIVICPNCGQVLINRGEKTKRNRVIND
jgi:predicted RNA-binding Zn-ribbon protein involved in translation (DUF1610 family)